MLAADHPRSNVVPGSALRLHYLEWGAAQPRVLICLHGVSGQAGYWQTVALAMRAHFRVIALDLRGHGESEWAAGANASGYDPDAYVDDLHSLIEGLRVHPVALLGLSLGGMVSMRYASLHPEMVERMVAVDISPAPGAHVVAGLESTAPSPASFDSLDSAVQWAREGYLWSRDAAVLRADLAGRLRQRHDGAWEWKSDPQASEMRWLGLWSQRSAYYWRCFSAIACPILVVRGMESDVLGTSICDRMCLLNSRCRCVDVPGAGHSVPLDRPRDFLRVVSEFLLR